MRNLGITSNIYRILLEEGRPMKPKHVARKMEIPDGWTYAKLRRNVASILINKLAPGCNKRWVKVAPGLYEAVVRKTWVRTGITIQHRLTGAEVKVVGKIKRNGIELHDGRCLVYSPTLNSQWPMWIDDIERSWRILGSAPKARLPIPVL